MALRAETVETLSAFPIAETRARGMVGREPSGRLCACLQLAEDEGVTEAQWVGTPSDLSEDEVTSALALWPAWRIVAAAKLELGSRAAIVGDGGLVSGVRVLAWETGVVLCATLSDNAAHLADARRQLDTLLDVVIVLSGTMATVAEAARMCRQRGTLTLAASGVRGQINAYPDMHRRSLVIRAVDPFLLCDDDETRWQQLAPWLARLEAR